MNKITQDNLRKILQVAPDMATLGMVVVLVLIQNLVRIRFMLTEGNVHHTEWQLEIRRKEVFHFG